MVKRNPADGHFSGPQTFSTGANELSMRQGMKTPRLEREVAFKTRHLMENFRLHSFDYLFCLTEIAKLFVDIVQLE